MSAVWPRRAPRNNCHSRGRSANSRQQDFKSSPTKPVFSGEPLVCALQGRLGFLMRLRRGFLTRTDLLAFTGLG
jgi:hypothetical protein